MKWNRGKRESGSTFSRRPVERLSRQMTSCPFRSSVSQRDEPIMPAPPATTATKAFKEPLLREECVRDLRPARCGNCGPTTIDGAVRMMYRVCLGRMHGALRTEEAYNKPYSGFNAVT